MKLSDLPKAQTLRDHLLEIKDLQTFIDENPDAVLHLGSGDGLLVELPGLTHEMGRQLLHARWQQIEQKLAALGIEIDDAAFASESDDDAEF